ncbi:hypothetical protein Slin15195_G074010 [Septoria linicola]|uniref:Uncharacterized protein n=1 Tax=Septoria linicola TaxID=215465 RepID=A0A9Q9AQX3_9PEZI|nr:hypothetical protein Slin14017_G035140 [Septoria linicola]USW54082.1 hypothetical protein Slin15195_G074010 [Septoria linicola]
MHPSLTDNEAFALVRDNPKIKKMLHGNVKREVDTQTSELKDTIAKQEKELLTTKNQNMALKSQVKALTDLGRTSKTAHASQEPPSSAATGLLHEWSDFEEWNQRMELLLRVRTHGGISCTCTEAHLFTSDEMLNAVAKADEVADLVKRDALKQVNLKFKEQTMDLELFRAALVAVRNAAEETPGRSVKEVWDVMQDIRPSPDVLPILTTPFATTPSQRSAAQHTLHVLVGSDVSASVRALYGYISPSLLARIPQTATTDLNLFWKCLRDLSRPSRLLDLPEDFKSRIYDASLALERNARDTCHVRDPLPALLCASKTIRHAARALYFAFTPFVLEVSIDFAQEPLSKEVRVRAQAWIDNHIKDEVKHLRSLTIKAHGSLSVTCTFSPEKGLAVNIQGHVNDVMSQKLTSAATGVEAVRAAMRGKGDSIIMFLWSNTSAWNSLSMVV